MTRSSMLLAGLLAGAAVVLPAGGRAAPAGDAVIAFSSTPANADRPDIYVMRADGSGVRRMTRKGGGEPAWSPDGRRIAYSRTLSGSFGASIWVVGARGGTERRLTRGGEAQWEPTWSPDGRRIAFEAWTSRGSAIGPVGLGDIQLGVMRRWTTSANCSVATTTTS